ncbi:MAG TPA: GNAT family N-acetyltransferase [Solirubrobacteraceae bacterium]|nr:GNAT family N-acetyltransferase [Solirubrobacteraceae bacterium]
METDVHGLPVRPLPDGSDIRRARQDELPRVARLLAAAFYDDPVGGWVYRDDGRRLARLEALFALSHRRVWQRHDEVWVTEHDAGAAVWMPPGTAKTGTWEDLRLMPPTIRSAGRDSVRLLRLLSAFDKKHPHEREHWYLPFVGVTPEYQGRGFGAALLRRVLDRCDADGTPAYLEASAPRNRALYERHGFVVREEIRVADSPPVWAMWREPA